MRKEVYAPILIPTLCRYEFFKNCVESLAKCTLADKTELYIGLDYPAKETHWEGYKKIKEYIPTITGFKNVLVVEHLTNQGSSKNVAALMKIISEKYDRYIFSEDDNVFSPCFLEFIHIAMQKYEDNKNVIAICGYNYPVSMAGYNKNHYASHEFSAWGTAWWLDRRFSKSKEMMRNILLSPSKVMKLAIHRSGIVITLINMLEKDALWSDTCNVALSYLYNKYSISPTLSLVRNVGHDGSGEHCLITDRFRDQDIDISEHFTLDDIDFRPPNAKEWKEYFSIDFHTYLYMIKRWVCFVYKVIFNKI